MKIGIFGVTGVVGNEMLKCLEKTEIKDIELSLFASKKSIGNSIKFKDTYYQILEFNPLIFKELDYALFAVSNELSLKYSKFAVDTKCIIIDNSSAFRMDPQVPLIIPEVNFNTINKSQIIANPNCVAILLNLAISKINKFIGIERLIISTYQAASGAGKEGLEELNKQFNEYSLNENVQSKKIFGRQYIFNAFSHNSKINIENGYNDEEIKIMQETKKILDNPELKISATSVRIPVVRSHCISVNIKLKKSTALNKIKELISTTKGVILYDDRVNNQFPEPIITANKNEVFIGRIRNDVSQEKNMGYDMFISGDQILKGAALNAIQILEGLTN